MKKTLTLSTYNRLGGKLYNIELNKTKVIWNEQTASQEIIEIIDDGEKGCCDVEPVDPLYWVVFADNKKLLFSSKFIETTLEFDESSDIGLVDCSLITDNHHKSNLSFRVALEPDYKEQQINVMRTWHLFTWDLYEYVVLSSDQLTRKEFDVVLERISFFTNKPMEYINNYIRYIEKL